MHPKVKWIVQTGVCLALLIIFQFATRPLSATPVGTLITGSLVNFVLVLTTLLASMPSGLTVAVVSPFMVFFLGIVPLPIFIVPAVACGNAVIVLVYWLLNKAAVSKTGSTKHILSVLAIPLGALCKFCVLFAAVKWLLIPLIGQAGTAFAAVYAPQQLLTAVIGGTLAVIAVPTLRRAVKANG